MLKAHNKRLGRGPEYLTPSLPMLLEDAPLEWRPHVRAASEPAEDLESLQRVAERVPLRRTHGAVSRSASAASLGDVTLNALEYPLDSNFLGRAWGGGHVPFVPTFASPSNPIPGLIIYDHGRQHGNAARMSPAGPLAIAAGPAFAALPDLPSRGSEPEAPLPAPAPPKRRRLSGKTSTEARDAEARSTPAEIVRASSMRGDGLVDETVVPASAAVGPDDVQSAGGSGVLQAEAAAEGSISVAEEQVRGGEEATALAAPADAPSQKLGSQVLEAPPVGGGAEAAARAKMAEALRKKEKEKQQVRKAKALKRPGAAPKHAASAEAEPVASPASAAGGQLRAAPSKARKEAGPTKSNACQDASTPKPGMKRPAAAQKRLKAAEPPANVERAEAASAPAPEAGAAPPPGTEEAFTNVEFHSACYGRCKREHYSKKSYIRNFQTEERKWRMIVGSEDPQHHRHVTRLLQVDVVAGKDRNGLRQARATYLERLRTAGGV